MKESDAEIGPVYVTGGTFAGRIGSLDDHDGVEASVFFGDIILHSSAADIPLRHLRMATTEDLIRRYDALGSVFGPACPYDDGTKLDALFEYHYIRRVLSDRILDATERPNGGPGVFLSHSSYDKDRVRLIALDLTARGYRPWFDEWDIVAGESIPRRISEGLADSEFVLVCLSPNAVASRWVEEEWHAKYWEEIQSRRVCVIPALLTPCDIPRFLQQKKYADFTKDFARGIEDLRKALKGSPTRRYRQPR